MKPEVCSRVRDVLYDWRALCEVNDVFPVAMIFQQVHEPHHSNMIYLSGTTREQMIAYLRHAADQLEKHGDGPVVHPEGRIPQ